MNCFLLTYRSFTQAKDILELLVARFDVPPPKNRIMDANSPWRQQAQLPIRYRVFNVCKVWITKYAYDASAFRDESFTKRFLAFLDEIASVRPMRLLRAIPINVKYAGRLFGKRSGIGQKQASE